jgi:hypothetical protein
MGAHAPKRRDPARRRMVGSAIAKQQDIGNLVLPKKVVDEAWPIPEFSAELCGALRPVGPIATADIDTLDLHSAVSHDRRQLVQKRAWRSLQEQERPLLRL